MSKYIKSFVTGYGIDFETSKRNQEAFEKGTAKWGEISSSLQITGQSVMLFCGAKNNGKSSLIRYLLNEYNRGGHKHDNETDQDEICDMDSSSNHQENDDDDRYAYYVDFDPGQPEMTTPGIVSAHIIKSNAQPLLSPPYLNVLQHKPVAMSCVGGTNMSVNPRMFIENCRFVYNQVKEHQSEQIIKRPIFINTMGFIRNVGLAMLMDLIKICKPTNLVVLNVEGDPMRTIYADLSANSLETTRASFYYETSQSTKKSLDYRYDIYKLQFSFVESSSISTKNRTASQLAYFCSIPDALYKPIMKLNYKWLYFNSISIYCVSSYPLKVNIVLELLYHSWIHLVKLRRPTLTKNETNENSTNEQNGGEVICNIIDDVGENIMFGCGIVANIDVVKMKLAIITPLSQETLNQEVDCVIKPLSIQVPSQMLQETSSTLQ